MSESDEKRPGRPPDYNLGCLNRHTEERGTVGAAWKNTDGSIRVIINPFVVLPCPGDCMLTLFPIKAKSASSAEPRKPFQRKQKPSEVDPPMETTCESAPST